MCTISVDQPRHPGKGAASALPTGTLLAPPFPTGNFVGTVFIVGLAGASGLLVEVLDDFVGGAPNAGGEPLRVGLSRFSFSPAPVVLGLPMGAGAAGTSLALLLSFDFDVRFFASALSTLPFFTCVAFRSAFFSLSGLSSSPLAGGIVPVTGSARCPVGVVSSPSALANGSDSGFSGELASMRMRLSGLGFTGE